ncbi:unnamed protein product [Prunus armeniaca]
MSAVPVVGLIVPAEAAWFVPNYLAVGPNVIVAREAVSGVVQFGGDDIVMLLHPGHLPLQGFHLIFQGALPTRRFHSGCAGWHNRVLSVGEAEDGTVGRKGRRRVHSLEVKGRYGLIVNRFPTDGANLFALNLNI